MEASREIKQEEKMYYPEVDLCKGFAIILVVLGHVFTYTQSTQLEKTVQIMIYSFHMPFFFMLSGITFHMQYRFSKFLYRKAKTLLVPAVLFSMYNILMYVVYLFFFQWENISVYINTILNKISLVNALCMSCKSPFSAYWFFPVLFSAEVIYYNLEKWKLVHIKKVLFLSGIIFSLILYQRGIVLPLGIEEALLILPFLDLGYEIKNKNIAWREEFALIILYIAGLFIWFRRDYGIIDLYNSHISDVVLFYLLGMTASLGIYFAIKQVNIQGLQWVRQIGKNSMYIYGIHYSLLPFWKEVNSKVPIPSSILKIIWDLIGTGVIVVGCGLITLSIKQIKGQFQRIIGKKC